MNSIITEAYRYTKSHRKLWFFGIFLSWVTVLNFGKFFSDEIAQLPFFGHGVRHALNLAFHSTYSTYVVVVIGVAVLGILLLTFSRICLINATVLLHQDTDEDLKLKKLVAQSTVQFWRVFAAGVLLNILLLAIGTFLFGPALFTLHTGYQSRGAFLLVVSIILFIPTWLFLTIVNIFASNFMVVFHLPFRKAVLAAVDLYFRSWDHSFALVAVLVAVYVLVFFMSAGVLGFASALAYALVFLLKSLSVPLYAPVAGLFLVAVTAVLVFVTAVLAVFTSIVWTLFFLSYIGAVPSGETEAAMARQAA